MWKILILMILIIGCDPTMATKYNTATATDTDGTKFVSAADLDRKGHIQASLTEWATTAKPNVAQESIVENNGTGFKTDTVGGDSISLVDPVTDPATVADGDVYIVLNGDSADAGYGDYSFTATAPTWSDSKQGYYLTGLFADYRAIGGCNLLVGVYYGKYIYTNRDQKIFSFSSSEYTEKIATEKTVVGTASTLLSPTFSNTFEVEKDNIYEIIVFGEIKTSSAASSAQYDLKPSASNTGAINYTTRQNLTAFLLNWNSDTPGVSNSIFGSILCPQTSYVPYLAEVKVIATTSGTISFDEYLNSALAGQTAYVRNRNIYIKKVNSIPVNK